MRQDTLDFSVHAGEFFSDAVAHVICAYRFHECVQVYK